MPWHWAEPTAPFSGSLFSFALGLKGCWGPVQQQQRLGGRGTAGTPERDTPRLAIPPQTQVPEVVQEGPSGLAGQGQGESPHQVIHLLLGRELLQGSEHLLLGSGLVSQDLVHLQGGACD